MYSQIPETLKLTRGDEATKVRISGKVRVDNATARLRFLHDGHGLAVVPYSDAKDDLENGNLVRVLPDWSLPVLTIYAVYPGDVTRSSKVKSLLDYMRRELAPIDHGRISKSSR